MCNCSCPDSKCACCPCGDPREVTCNCHHASRTVRVPVTGTYLVTDGVVQRGSLESVCGGTVHYWHPEGE